ncbi:MAG: hypothetical protein K6G24_06520 [Lachnospiraceae bacterium]|nr:hypothetical protein [Lachnospiraceae bacterium]
MFKSVRLIAKRPHWCDFGSHTLRSNAFNALCLRISDYVVFIEGIRVKSRKQFELLMQALVEISKGAGIKHIVCAGIYPSSVIQMFEDYGFFTSRINSTSNISMKMDL